jgi:hypothetical protein
MAKKPPSRKAKRLEQYLQTRPPQLTLFELLDQDRDYSNSIELYDFIPKYVWGRVEREKAEKSHKEVLPNLKRDFECRGVAYQVLIKPASIEGKDGVARDYFPSKREELVEDALRKIACEGAGIFLDDQAGLTFTLYQLHHELKARGHGYKIADLKEALYILSETHLELTTADGKTVLKTNMFQGLGLTTQEDWKDLGKKTMGFVRFNPLVTAAIKNLNFRQLDYEKAMSFVSVIARQLYKRMSHHYIQASRISQPYGINLSTIIRDFGLTPYAELRNNLRDVVRALDEMKSKNVVRDYHVEKATDPQKGKKLIDANIAITTTDDFIWEMRKANQKAKERESARIASDKGGHIAKLLAQADAITNKGH